MEDRRRIPRSIGSADGSAGGETLLKAITDRLIALAGKVTKEDIDEQVSKALPLKTVNEMGLDPYGIDIDTARMSVSLLVYLHRYWFRTEVHGIEHVPDTRVLLVGNHSGQIPLDGVAIALSLLLDTDRPRFSRGMIERFVSTLPFLSVWFSRVGQVLGTPENARHLLEQDEALIVFPEGVKGISKTFSERYKLAPFGQGFMRLALETNSPIVPVAVIGAEEQAPAINFKPLARLLGTPAFPIVPYPPFVAPVPLPVKYRLYFGEPIRLTGDPDDDDEVLDEKVKQVRNRIQS
ncbi:MAG TPA: lysophospholipid acyltransferase family protein, partial [Polyangiales bacterium]|nr:lysophospholipid acyltransferase family protein [Polyangiales bacterium]